MLILLNICLMYFLTVDPGLGLPLISPLLRVCGRRDAAVAASVEAAAAMRSDGDAAATLGVGRSPASSSCAYSPNIIEVCRFLLAP